MKNTKLKKLQLITVLLLIIIILFMIIGLFLIGFCDYYSHMLNQSTFVFEDIEKNGFQILSITSIIHILGYSANYVCYMSQNSGNYYPWIQLQIGVVFCLILVPILLSITMSIIFLIIGLKTKIKNNNFWDAIEKCEIINNYYIH